MLFKCFTKRLFNRGSSGWSGRTSAVCSQNHVKEIDMRVRSVQTIAVILAVGLFAVQDAAVQASTLLTIDYERAGYIDTESGFNSFAGSLQTYSEITNTYGAYTVTTFIPSANGGYNNRGALPAGTPLAKLYSDFAYLNGTTDITITVGGLAPNTDYVMKFYAFDHIGYGRTHTVKFTPTTVGNVATVVFSDSALPTTADQYSATATWTSNAAGLIQFHPRDTWTDGTNSGVGSLINGFRISSMSTPEPGTLVLVATGLLGLLAYAWRKRK